MSRRSSLLALALLIAALVVLTLSDALIAGPRVQRRSLAAAFPGFACDRLVVEHPSGSRSAGHRLQRSAMRMPPACLADLARRVRDDPRFRADVCNGVERCWRRGDGARAWTLTFHRDYLAYRYEERVR